MPSTFEWVKFIVHYICINIKFCMFLFILIIYIDTLCSLWLCFIETTQVKADTVEYIYMHDISTYMYIHVHVFVRFRTLKL